MISKDSRVQIEADESDKENYEQQAYPKSTMINLRVDEDIVKGICEQFISKKQKAARQLNYYQIPNQEHENWQPMACHFRNIEYTSINVRTPKTLQQCLQFICKEYLPYYKQIFQNQSQRKKLQLFLYDRVRSIRCQLFVQAIFEPKMAMKLIKLILFLEMMIEQPIQLAGLEYFFAPQVKSNVLGDQCLKQYFNQALELAIYWKKKQKLLALLADHFDEIQKQQKLQQALNKKLKILNKNYIVYFTELLKNKNIYIRFILWSYIIKMRQIFIAHYKKAKMNQKAGFICRVLGYSKMDGWIDLSKQADQLKLQSHKCQFDLDIKLWISQKDLFNVLNDLLSDIN